MSERDRARRVLEALRARPGLLTEVVRLVRAIPAVLSPWERGGPPADWVARRRDAVTGTPFVWVKRRGDEYWVMVGAVDAETLDGAAGGITEALDMADAELARRGYILLDAPQGRNEGDALGPWGAVPGDGEVVSVRADEKGRWVAALGVDHGDGEPYYGIVRGRLLQDERGDLARGPNKGSVQMRVDEVLRVMGHELGEPPSQRGGQSGPVGLWKAVKGMPPHVAERRDAAGDVVGVVSVQMGPVGESSFYVGEAEDEYVLDEHGGVADYETEEMARHAVDDELRARGYALDAVALRYWEWVPARADVSSARYDIDGNMVGVVRVVGNRAAGYFADVEGKTVERRDGEPVECVSDAAARKIADERLRELGYTLQGWGGT